MIVDQKTKKQIVGVYLIDGDISGGMLATGINPNIFRKIIMRWILGWKWIEIKNLKTENKINYVN